MAVIIMDGHLYVLVLISVLASTLVDTVVRMITGHLLHADISLLPGSMIIVYHVEIM